MINAKMLGNSFINSLEMNISISIKEPGWNPCGISTMQTKCL